jgi:hypothetical protein
MVTAPVTNKKISKMPIQVTLPDGASVKSSHTCDLILPQLPDTAKKTHVIQGLSTSSLLPVGQLVGADYSVTFDKTKVHVLHNQAKNWKDSGTCETGYGPSICRTTIHNHHPTAKMKKKQACRLASQHGPH